MSVYANVLRNVVHSVFGKMETLPVLKKFVLGAAALAFANAVSHPAHAVSLNPHGVGQALIYPYYTVNKGQDTLISVVNTSWISKAVQVRFREAYNGREALSFVLYLGPYDVWTASLTETSDDGGPVLKTSDASCTAPLIPSEGMPLGSAGYDGTSPAGPADGGPQDIMRTREGSLELIVGADVMPSTPTAAAIVTTPSGLPSCTGLEPMAFSDLRPPTHGIYGSVSIVNVSAGTFFAYNADALEGFTGTQLFSAAVPLGPTLADANSPESTLGGAVAYVNSYANGPAAQTLALDYQNGIDAVSAVLMAGSIYGEYFVDPELGANTDWIETFPTKNFYVDKALYPANPTAPFEQAFSAPGISNVAVDSIICDREQRCQQIATTAAMSYQVNAIPIRAGNAFIAASSVFGSNQMGLAITPIASSGNITMDLAGGLAVTHELAGGQTAGGDTASLFGLPVTGFMAYNIVNANAQQNVLANYGGIFPLRETAACDGAAGDCP